MRRLAVYFTESHAKAETSMDACWMLALVSWSSLHSDVCIMCGRHVIIDSVHVLRSYRVQLSSHLRSVCLFYPSACPHSVGRYVYAAFDLGFRALDAGCTSQRYRTP